MRPHFTEADLRQFNKNMGKGGVDGTRFAGLGSKEGSRTQPPTGSAARPTRSRAGSNPAPSPQYKSKLEARWSNYLDVLKAATVIEDWKYEPINFRLPGKKNFYKIDFLYWNGPVVTFCETKGWNKSDDRSLVKLKTAAGLHPWARFIQVKWIDGEWVERTIS